MCVCVFVCVCVQEDYSSGRTSFDQGQVEAAISGVLFEVIEPEQTVSGTAENVVINHFRNLSLTHSRWEGRGLGSRVVQYL